MLTNDKQNLLELWKAQFYLLSSDLSIKKYIDRLFVDHVYKTLLDFWGEQHFKVNLLDVIRDDKLHFIIAALNKRTVASFYFLFETSLLIEWIKINDLVTYQKLDSVKYRTDTCREVLFEIYTDWIFWYNKIPYTSAIWVGDQLKEGYCEIGGTTYLIECKKKYSLGMEQLKIRQYITASILKIAQNINFGLECICLIRFKDKNNFNRAGFSKVLKEFKNYLVNRVDYYPEKLLDYEFMSVELLRFDLDTMEKISRNEIENDIYVTFQNTYEIDEGDQLRFRVNVGYNIIVNHAKIITKLIASVHKAMSQHRNDDTPKIIMIDNESIEDFTTPMLNGNITYEQKLQDYINRRESNDVVILLYRNFTQAQPSISFAVICKPELQDIKDKLMQIDFRPIDMNKLILQ